MEWCLKSPDVLLEHHSSGRRFLAIHPSYGVVISAEDEDELQARMNDLRPSVLKQLYATCTSLWVHTPPPVDRVALS